MDMSLVLSQIIFLSLVFCYLLTALRPVGKKMTDFGDVDERKSYLEFPRIGLDACLTVTLSPPDLSLTCRWQTVLPPWHS